VWFGDGALMNKPNGPGVVLYLEHYDGFDRDKDIRPRNTNEEVYQQIIKDLEEAIVDLPESNDVTEVEARVSRANKTICEALLARTYLYKHDFTKAAEMAQTVLGKTEYMLETDLLMVFPPNQNDAVIPFSKEHIFGFPVSSNGGNWQFGGNSIYYSFNNFWYSEDFNATITDTDERRTKLIRTAINSGNTIYVTNKYPNSNGRDNMTMIRLSEMILTRAEALVVGSGQITVEAVNLLNEVYLRANPTESGFTSDDFSSVQELVEAIWLERSKELCFEGLQRFDQLRTGRPLYNADLAENKKALPIPLREVEITNGVLKQNEGYLTN